MKSNNDLVPPLPDEIEVTVFGPGVGEAIVVHLGNSQWLIVDSCISRSSKNPIALDYLNEIGVDLANEVKLIVATHWHDDHIRGISQALQKCPSAKFSTSGALGQREFQLLLDLYSQKTSLIDTGVDEFIEINKILHDRRARGVRFNSPKWACVDRQLFFDENPLSPKVYALSPSDESMMQAKLSFANTIPENGRNVNQIQSPSQNHASVALLIVVGNHTILLGADLERTKNPQTGWKAILDDSSVMVGKIAEVFKVPHHGSQNAYDEQVWDNMLISSPFAVVTPYNRGKKPLPAPEDVNRILLHTPYLFTTSPNAKKYKGRDNLVRKSLRRATKKVNYALQDWGFVRLRVGINDDTNSWRYELFGTARQLKHNK